MSSLDSPTASLNAENDVLENAALESDVNTTEAPSLANKVKSGVGWTTFGSLVGQVLTFGRTLILARLLTTGDFGLMGMAFTLTSALGSLTDLNLNTSAVVAKFKDDEQMHRHLNTIWTVNIVRGLLVSLVLLAAAAPTARFYGEGRLLPILLILAWTPLLLGCTNIGLTLASRQVNLSLMVKYGLATTALSLLLTTILAFWTRNVWALVWGNLLGTALGVGLSYMFHPYRPRLQFDRSEFKSAFNFGKWMFAIGVLSYITTTADNVLVGRFLGAGVLGAYVVAYSIANLPQNVVGQILGGVLLPSFAELGRSDHARLEKTLLRVFTLGCALLTLVTMPMSLLAPQIIAVAFDIHKWQAAIVLLQILVLVGLFRGLIQIIAPLLVGMNRPEIEARSVSASAVAFIALLYPLTRYFGAQGAAWAGVITYVFAFVLRCFMARSLAPRAFARFPLIMAQCALGGLGGAAAGALAVKLLVQTNWSAPLLQLVVGTSVAVPVAFLILIVLQPALNTEFAKLWLSLKNRFAPTTK